jgi:hypothetical protein
MKVRFAACRQYKDKQYCVPFGLGWCCDANCRWQAIERRRRGQQLNTAPRRQTPRRSQPNQEQRNKARARERDHCCRWCGVTRHLHVHHIVYRSERGSHQERNLITLCDVHHDLAHSNKRKWQPVLKELIRLYYDESLYLTVPEVERRLAVAA